MNIAILGAGMVGSTIAKDLVKFYKVTAIDVNDKALRKLNKYGIDTKLYNLKNNKGFTGLLKNFDLVVCAVPGFMGYKTLEAVIKAKKNVVDISFFSEDAANLHKLAVKQKVTAIVDCGVAPGMSNLILGRYNELMNIESFECMVGGLPKKRELPFEYKAPFSPIDVMEEYSRPARFISEGKLVTLPALSNLTQHNFSTVGTLESFLTDGLRSLLKTMKHIPNVKEKTLRYPGHANYILGLKAAGFLSTKKIKINNELISPLEFTSTLLIDQWKLADAEEEFTVMQIDISGIDKKTNVPKQVTYHLYDAYDVATQTSSMSRCTGYTCTAVVHLLVQNRFTKNGVFPPEVIGAKEIHFNFIMNYLTERNVHYQKTEI